jgi:molybdate transport system permease protein
MLGCLSLLSAFLLILILSVLAYTGLELLVSALLTSEIQFALKLSVITASISTMLALIVGIPVAYALSRFEFRGKDVMDVILNIPIIMPPIALGAALLIFFNTPIASWVRDIFVFQPLGIVLAQFTVVVALAIRLLKNTFDSIDPRYENMARVFGYSRFQSFFRVTLPLSGKGLLAAAIIAWTRAIGEFGATVTLAGATKFKTETLSIAIYLSLASADVSKASAVVLILVVLAITSLLMVQKNVKGGVIT